MAILYLSMHPNVDLRGITTTGGGACHLTPGTRNALGLLQLTGKPDVPVAKGTSAPLSYSNVFPQSIRGPDRRGLQRAAAGKSEFAGVNGGSQ
jgi:inosine-uridine nucleoside N-ribohydrolase